MAELLKRTLVIGAVEAATVAETLKTKTAMRRSGIGHVVSFVAHGPVSTSCCCGCGLLLLSCASLPSCRIAMLFAGGFPYCGLVLSCCSCLFVLLSLAGYGICC